MLVLYYFKLKNLKFLMDKLKRNWKNILLILFILFGMSKCTQSCNRQSTINKQTEQIEHLDSTITVLKADTLQKAHIIDIMTEQLNTANEKVNLAVSKSETAKANEETAAANAARAKAERDAAVARAKANSLRN